MRAVGGGWLIGKRILGCFSEPWSQSPRELVREQNWFENITGSELSSRGAGLVDALRPFGVCVIFCFFRVDWIRGRVLRSDWFLATLQ